MGWFILLRSIYRFQEIKKMNLKVEKLKLWLVFISIQIQIIDIIIVSFNIAFTKTCLFIFRPILSFSTKKKQQQQTRTIYNSSFCHSNDLEDSLIIISK